MAKRVKSDRQLVKFDSWAGVDYIVQRIGALQGDIEKAELNAQKKIDAIKAGLAESVKTAQESITVYTESIEAWSVAYRVDFSGQQSRKLNHGTIGWRKSTVIDIQKNAKTLELIKSIYGKDGLEFIHVSETPNKEAMARLTDEGLAHLSARRKHKEVFFVEPEKVEAADHG